jgi:hypothetical protein
MKHFQDLVASYFIAVILCSGHRRSGFANVTGAGQLMNLSRPTDRAYQHAIALLFNKFIGVFKPAFEPMPGTAFQVINDHLGSSSITISKHYTVFN